MKKVIEKKLSPNDIGITGGHQAGILIPKKDEILNFFPQLDRNAENPRAVICFKDDLDQVWKFNYIYYNNRLRGGTRNEYRLTGMTKYLRHVNALVGDVLMFENDDGDYSVSINKETSNYSEDNGVVTLILDESWRIIHY